MKWERQCVAIGNVCWSRYVTRTFSSKVSVRWKRLIILHWSPTVLVSPKQNKNLL